MTKETALKSAFRVIEISYGMHGQETKLSLWHNSEDKIVGEIIGEFLQEKAKQQVLSEVTVDMICEFVMNKHKSLLVYSERDWKILNWIIGQRINLC